MGLWIVEPKDGQHVAGTVELFGNDSGSTTVDVIGQGRVKETEVQVAVNLRRLKRGDGKDTDIFLVPQPSDSPNDPLNWPLWKKDLALAILCMATATASCVGPALAPVTAVIAEEFKTTYGMAANLSGYQFLAVGTAGLFCEVAARLWGRRPVYLLSIAFLVAGCLWNIFVHSIPSFLGARILQGVGLGTFETLVMTSIGDMYFVHQRGKRVALYNLALQGTAYFTPILAGRISRLYHWRAQFIFMSVFNALAFILVFLFCPEHAYNRPARFEIDYASQGDLSGSSSLNGADNAAVRETNSISSNREKEKTFVQGLKLYNGRFSNDSFLKLLLAPFPCMLYPATIWVFFFQCTFVTWGIEICIVTSALFSGAPTFFTPEQVGYLYTAPTIGAISAYFLGCFLSDSLAKRLTRKNNNIYEPEFRLALVIPVLLTGVPGIIGFGYAVRAHVHWAIASLLFGLFVFAVVMSCISSYAYLLDAHRDLSVEIMVAVMLLRNFFAFTGTQFTPNWVLTDGPVKAFGVMGAVQGAICVMSFVMYRYGKCFRWWMQKLAIMKRLGLYPEEKMRKEKWDLTGREGTDARGNSNSVEQKA